MLRTLRKGAFRPSPGPLTVLTIPNRAGVRFDSGYAAGDEVLPYYDSLIAKLVVWAPTRAHAIDRTLEVHPRNRRSVGVPTTLPAAAVVLEPSRLPRGRNQHPMAGEQPGPRPAAACIGGQPNRRPPEADPVDDSDRQEVFVGGRRYYIPLPLVATPLVRCTGARILGSTPGAEQEGEGDHGRHVRKPLEAAP